MKTNMHHQADNGPQDMDVRTLQARVTELEARVQELMNELGVVREAHQQRLGEVHRLAQKLSAERENAELRAELADARAIHRLQGELIEERSQGLHTTPDNCPTWYDCCHCTPESCVAAYEALDRAERDRDTERARVRELEARLKFDPGGSDKIDELEQALQFVKHDREIAETRADALAAQVARVRADNQDRIEQMIANVKPGQGSSPHTLGTLGAIGAREQIAKDLDHDSPVKFVRVTVSDPGMDCCHQVLLGSDGEMVFLEDGNEYLLVPRRHYE